VSGQAYTITDVAGRPPLSLTDFENGASVTIVRNGSAQRLLGSGERTPDGLRFHQKDAGADGKDVRVWAITEVGDGTFRAEPMAAF
jgi:hypothetical protein